MFDTGATCSVVSPRVVLSLGLTQTGTSQMSTGLDTRDHPVCSVDFVLAGEGEIKGFQRSVLVFDPGGQGDVLLGLDVISFGVLTVADSWFSFEVA